METVYEDPTELAHQIFAGEALGQMLDLQVFIDDCKTRFLKI